MIIRPYRETDLSGLLTCWEAASRSATPFLSNQFIITERENIQDLYLPKLTTIVAERLGTLSGFICHMGNEVAGLFVCPTEQGKGVGTSLLDHTHRANNTRTAEVLEANLKARAFYYRYGFRQTGRRIHEEVNAPLLSLTLDATRPEPLYAIHGQET